MHQALRSLLDALTLERVAERAFEGGSPGGMGDHLFGGQVLAQGLAAADHLAEGIPVHSLHAYFLRRGTPAERIRYDVTPLRASRSFRTFQVTAVQGGAPILEMTASYHEPEVGPCHQIPMDEVGPPEGEAYEREMLRTMMPGGVADDAALPFELPVEIRSVGGLALFTRDVKPPSARCWMRVRGELPEDPALHACLFAYASDYAIMAPALHPHPAPVTAFQSASLDHALWFHRPFRMDEWLLFEIDSPISYGARGLGRGLLYTREGILVGSCVQEGLLRPLSEGQGKARAAKGVLTPG
jgi:acyl-CoA thioesterase-2